MKDITREYIDKYNQLFIEFGAIYRTVAARLGLPDCAFWIFYMLESSEATCRQRDICNVTSLSRQTVNSAIRKLKTEGYLYLKHEDGLSGKKIYLTEKGHRFAENHVVPIMRVEENVCKSFTKEEIEAFLVLFGKLVKMLDLEMKKIDIGTRDGRDYE